MAPTAPPPPTDQPQAKRSAGLLISVTVDRDSSPAWSAALTGYDDASSPARPLGRFTTADEVVAFVRRWLARTAPAR